MDIGLEKQLRALRAEEYGAGVVNKHAPLRMCLLYPSPYHVGMSSLGFLQIHRLANGRPGTVCERAFLPEKRDVEIHRRTRTGLMCLESLRPVNDSDLIGISIAYELELAGIVTALELSGLAPLAADRDETDPLVILGGPLTFSNPLPAAPFADLVVLGEGETKLKWLLDYLEETPEAARGSKKARTKFLELCAEQDGILVPSIHGEYLPSIAKADDESLPAVSEIYTPNTELSDMVLIEPERGCHRGCTFCVMRRSTNGGMRLVAPDKFLHLVPDKVGKVGLVGAAVTDHPRIKDILRALIEEKGKRIGISSLRADRLDEEFVSLLTQGGYRSMTVAMDAPSERLMYQIEKNLRHRHLEKTAELAKQFRMKHLKVYTVAVLPEETDEDIESLIDFTQRLSKIIPIVLGVSPFVPKFHTPLAHAPFAGEKRAQKVITTLRKRLGHRIQIRGPSAKEAYVEYRLSQGGFAHAQAAIVAAQAGGSLGAWKRALAPLPERVEPKSSISLAPSPTKRRRRWKKSGSPLTIISDERPTSLV